MKERLAAAAAIPAMKEILIITASLLATIARLLGRGDAKAIVAELAARPRPGI